jgi:hypothetical protein
MDKSQILRAFNTLFFQFLNEVIVLFPENHDLVIAHKSFETIKGLNVSGIIKAWNFFVARPYKEKIEAGDISFFIEKDYSEDLSHLSNAKEVMNTIDKFRNPIKDMTPASQAVAIDYIQKLCQLSSLHQDG